MNDVTKFAPKRAQQVPKAALPDEAEEEIRRNISRYHAMKAEIAELTNDCNHYKNRTELAEAVVGKLKRELADYEAENHRLRDINSTLRTYFETGVDQWVKAIDLLKAEPQAKVVIPKLENKTDEPADHHDRAS